MDQDYPLLDLLKTLGFIAAAVIAGIVMGLCVALLFSLEPIKSAEASCKCEALAAAERHYAALVVHVLNGKSTIREGETKVSCRRI
jgi:hypothetical protein